MIEGRLKNWKFTAKRSVLKLKKTRKSHWKSIYVTFGLQAVIQRIYHCLVNCLNVSRLNESTILVCLFFYHYCAIIYISFASLIAKCYECDHVTTTENCTESRVCDPGEVINVCVHMTDSPLFCWDIADTT